VYLTRRGLAFLVVFLAACGTATPTAAPATPATTLRVLAVASLTESLIAAATAFSAANQDVRVEPEFAPALDAAAVHPDIAVIITDDGALVDSLESAGRTAEPYAVIAHDTLAVVAPRTGARVERLEDLNAGLLRIAVARESQPLYAATRSLVETLRHDAAFGPDFGELFDAHIVARERDSRAVVDAVARGDADAGIAYESDAWVAHERVALVEVPPVFNVAVEYRAAVLKDKGAPGRAFVEFLLSPPAQAIFREYGFKPK
jgi:molybdate transport system substrate-binding protein